MLSGALTVCPDNPRYFATPDGSKIVIHDTDHTHPLVENQSWALLFWVANRYSFVHLLTVTLS